MAETQKHGPVRVGFVGCGHIAQYHIRFVQKLRNATVVGLADREKTRAQRLGEPYGVGHICGSLEELLDSTQVDVLHVLTPPEWHYDHALKAINRGVHVLLEKPCTLQAFETEDLYRHAAAKCVLICPDFIQLFHPVFQHARVIIDSGRLGSVVHIESYLGVDVNVPELRESVGVHWGYTLPGGILHRSLSHPLYLALNWLGEPKRVSVSSQSHGTLPQGLTDHLAILLEGDRCTASVVLSCAVSPESYYVRVFCERGIISVDFDSSNVLLQRVNGLPRSLRRATSNFTQACQLSAWSLSNAANVARGNLVPYQGLQGLITRFYSSICNGTDPPVSRELATAVSRTEDAIIAQGRKLSLNTCRRSSRQSAVTRKEKVLVTGAAGYLGSHVTSQLVREGYYVRAFVRGLSHTESLERLGVELVYGDLRDCDSLRRAGERMDVVVHLAAALRGTDQFVLDCSIEGTKNVAEAVRLTGVKRVIYVSSMSVYDFTKLRDGDVISEKSPLEEFPESRGTYSCAKRRAEEVAMAHLTDVVTAWTILRPSVIVGGDHDVFAAIGRKLANVLLCWGSPRRKLRLIHVEDVGTAIIKLLQNDGTSGRVFTLSHQDSPTSQDYVDGYIRKRHRATLHVIYVPHWLAALGVRSMVALRRLTRMGPRMNMRRLAYAYRDVRVDSSAIVAQTGWQPTGKILERLAAIGRDEEVDQVL